MPTAALAALASAAPAAAHSRSAPVALDYRLHLTAPPGIEAAALDGQRTLRLRVEPGLTVVVRGYLGELFLRFTRSGLWANGRSPTAAANKVVRSGKTGRIRVARGRSFAWHDHRLAPPRMELPVTVAGRTGTVSGIFERVPRPPAWPWGAAALLVLALASLVGWKVPARRGPLAVVAAVAAACGALAGTVAYADAGAAVAVVGGAAAAGLGVLAREAWHELPLGARR